jgi:hypothetical protein
MDTMCGTTEQGDGLQHLDTCCRGSPDSHWAEPGESIEAQDGENASAFDLVAFLRAGRAMAPPLAALHRLWESKRTAAMMPSRRDFRVEELGPWLGHLMLVDAIDAGQDFAYRVFGTSIAEFLGHDLTGKRLSTIAPQRQRPVSDEYNAVIAARRPRYVVGSPFLSRRFAVVARAILPLSHAGCTVDQLLIGFYNVGTGT